MEADLRGKSAACTALAQLLRDMPAMQHLFIASLGLQEAASLMRGAPAAPHSPAAAAAASPGAPLEVEVQVAACRLVGVLATHSELYGGLEPNALVATLMELMQHRDEALAGAAAQTAGVMAVANESIRGKMVDQVRGHYRGQLGA